MREAIAHYKVLEPLGAGGLGEVYRARDTNLGRTVAVKVLPPSITDDPERLQSLLDIVPKLVELSHPNIAILYEAGQDGEQRYLAFEFVQGEPLGALIHDRPLNARRAIDFAINLCDGLAEAHAAGLIHGDIRPGTIQITPKDRAKFMNFGLGRFTGGSVLPNDGIPYLSPEERSGAPASPQSDIYSLGAVIFEMLTGRKRDRGLSLRSINPSVPVELERVVGRMLASNLETRAGSAASIAAELRDLASRLDTRTEASEAASAAEAHRFGRRQARSRRTLSIVLLLAALGAVAFWWF
jgi:serine/threonine protein kinase